jgi:hypothetical protein
MGRLSASLTVLLLFCASVAFGQDVPLSRFLSGSVVASAQIARPLTGQTATAQGDTAGHFSQTALRLAAPAELDAALGLQMTTFPTAFAWGAARTDPASKPEPRLRGTGASFVELPSTLGKGRIAWSFGSEAIEFGRVDGVDLRSGRVAVHVAHDDCCQPYGTTPAPDFERDLLEETITVDVDRRTYAFYGSFGVTDRLDIGLMLPVVSVYLDSRVTARILRTATAASPGLHAFDDLELANRTSYYAQSASGIGDIQARAKYRLTGDSDGLALSFGAYLPTGDADKLLGAGSFRGDVSLLWSARSGAFSPRANVGYTLAPGSGAEALGTPIAAGGAVASSRDLPDVLHFLGGVDWTAHRRVHFSADFMGRRLSGLTRFSLESVTFPARGPGAAPTTSYVGANNLTAEPDGASPMQAMGILAARVLVGPRLLCNVDVMLPLNHAGVMPRVGAVVGFSWTF